MILHEEKIKDEIKRISNKMMHVIISCNREDQLECMVGYVLLANRRLNKLVNKSGINNIYFAMGYSLNIKSLYEIKIKSFKNGSSIEHKVRNNICKYAY